jgi:endonuclease/exonuclease/phosphatase family metal-dependent hydrolase
MNVQAETWVYFENNTPLSFSVNTTQTGTHTLSPGEWNVSASTVGAWEGQKELMWTNRNSGIHNGDDFFFDMVLTDGANNSVTLKLKVTGTFTSSDMFTSASGPGFSHSWYSNNNFHQASFNWGGKSYTLKYHSYFTGGYDDVFFALHENDPYPLNPADTTDPNTLNILAYNIYMLTPPIGNTDQTTRAAEIHKHVHGYDAIIISEAFYNSARSTLQAGLAPEYPYMTAVVDNGVLNDDGGVFIASRFPIISSSQIVYNDCNGSDCLAAKGVMHAEINKHGRVFHLFGTHTQAWPSAADVATRILQFKELQAFITSLNIPATEPVIIGGDLNVDMIANNLGEYDGMLDSLNLMEPTYTGHPYSYDGAISSYASPGVEFLDYVMTQNNHLSPLTAENEVLILRSIADDMFNMFDLSDHLAVRGRFVFPPLLSVDKMETTTALQSKVYPNPTSGNLTVDFGELIAGSIQIFNPLGILVYEHKIDNKQQHKIDLGDLPKGIYYLNINSEKYSVVLHKIIKAK